MFKKNQQVTVIGLGYIGLPTASLLATSGYDVFGYDINPNVIKSLEVGATHIKEHDLDVLVSSAIFSKNLIVSDKPQSADVFIITVPTPFKDNHAPDLSYVEKAIADIAPLLTKGNLVILESTSPVGTTQRLFDALKKLRPDLFDEDNAFIDMAYCPERVLPGQILRELVDNDRIIGGVNEASALKAKAFYASFVHGRIFLTDSRTAELVKLTENAYRDVNIAFANEMANICEKNSVDVWEVIQLANHHPRVNILNPGPGVGGHCIAVDPWFLIHHAESMTPLLQSARFVNDQRPNKIIERVLSIPNIKKIACLGLAYKANIDDLRESPAVDITLSLMKKDFEKILIVEPNIQALPEKFSQSNVSLVSLEYALKEADLLILLVDHQPFKEVKPEVLADKLFLDTRGIWKKL
jgi:UDP-N-acetyl-D-mannosaminuronic acid dehydrogenase